MFKKTFEPVWVASGVGSSPTAAGAAAVNSGSAAGQTAKGDVIAKGIALSNATIGNMFDVNIALAPAEAAKTKSKSFST